MQRETRLSLWCERIIEAGWLLALTWIPLYFNLFSARHFEPDKATTLRSIVLVMAAVGIIRALEMMRDGPAPVPSREPTGPSLRQRLTAVPLAVPTLVYTLVFIFATIISVVPLTSFWGSYQRLQGTYTNLSYIGLFVMILVSLRRRDQIERLVTVAMATGMAVACYGILQHFGQDPLPWEGDVIARVASTMGNAIFVAAYLILVLPLALYRGISNLSALRHAPPSSDPRSDMLWGLAYTLLFGGVLALLLAGVKFGAVVRTADFRYWWALPAVIAIATMFWALTALNLPHRDERPPLWPGFTFILYLLIFSMTFALSSGSGQMIDERITRGLDWSWWFFGGTMGVIVFYGLALTLPRRTGPPSRLMQSIYTSGSLIAIGTIVAAIFFSQSRGPWIGAGAGLFFFFSLLLWQAGRQATQQGATQLAQRLRIALGGWIVLTLAVGGFIVAFNLSDAAFFKQLRTVPYVGRMGQLLEVDTGTGLVRRLIWSGDEHAGGAIALITSDPVRAIIGWGPESMFVAYNRFYPPSLAQIESRGASPDRSHEALLDELVNKGVLGLVSYLFLLVSFFILAWRLIQRSNEWQWKVFFIACFSIVVSHFVEGLTGIPIVSTLTMLWVTLGITVTGGMVAGLYEIGRVAQPAPTTEPTTTDQAASAGEEASATARRKPTPANAPGRSPRTGQGSVARGAAMARRSSARYGETSAGAWVVYALIGGLTFGAVWWFNLNPVYADMRFQQGQSYSDQAAGNINSLIVGMDDYLTTIRSNPREDFYYLNLGRSLMNVADTLRSQGKAIGQPKTNAKVEDLLRLQDPVAVQSFIQASSPMSLMSYAEAVLKRARELNSMNKDHYANLGRLNNFWYSWTQDPTRLKASLDWYAQVSAIAPQDVTLINERASVVALFGDYTKRQGNDAEAQGYYTQAEELLKRSKELDARYTDTDARLADVLRLQGKQEEAVALYVQVLQRAPHQLDQQIERIALGLVAKPELLRKLRDVYEEKAGRDALLHAIAGLLSIRAGDLDRASVSYQQATTIQPQNLDFHRNYTLVLSDTRRYTEAVTEAQATLTLAQGQTSRQQDVAPLQALIAFLQQQAGQ